MAKKKNYSAKERKAYHMGRAYQTAKEGKRVACPDEKTKESFRNGVNSVKSKSSVQNGGSRCYLVNDSGEILKVYGGGKS